MQNEACIKQGSEKESFRQQLIDATASLKHYLEDVQLDRQETDALQAIHDAALDQRMSPKAYLQAVSAATKLREAKDAVLQIGYQVNELGEFSEAQRLADSVREYQTARAVVLGFQKSLTPSGWDILED
jgi:hypothetical protein